MKNFLIIISVLFTVQLAYTQDKNAFAKEVILGGLIPLGKDISTIYNQGISAEFRFSKDLNKFINYRPFISYSFYGNKWSGFQTEVLHFFSLGINANYRYAIKPDLNLYAGPSLNLNYYADRLITYNGRSVIFSDKRNTIISDFGLSYDFRIGMSYKRILFEFNYRPYASIPHINESIVATIENQDELYQLYQIKERKFNLSMLSINIGIKL